MLRKLSTLFSHKERKKKAGFQWCSGGFTVRKDGRKKHAQREISHGHKARSPRSCMRNTNLE